MNRKTYGFLLVLMVLGLLLGTAAWSFAQTTGEETEPEEEISSAFRATDLPLPRFVSLGSQKIFMRAGPGVRYPIKWVYEREGLPVEIILEYEVWRKIRDIEGVEGWVHQSLLSGRRTGLIRDNETQDMRASPRPDARIMARLEPMAQFIIKECRPGWCSISADGYEGWLPRDHIWGIYEDENFD